jgi:hypothetical protein
MRKIWKKSIAAVASISLGIAVGTGCGSEEKVGKVKNKKKAQAVETADADAEKRQRKISEIPWLRESLVGIDLSRVQAKKVLKINNSRAKGIKGRAEMGKVMAESGNELLAQMAEGADPETQKRLDGLREAIENPTDDLWLEQVRGVLREKQQEVFDSNTAG